MRTALVIAGSIALALAYPTGEVNVCATLTDGVYLSAPCTNSFVFCNNYVQTVHNCHDGLFYNSENKQCDYKENIGACAVPAQLEPFSCEHREDGQYVDGCSSEFWHCSGGVMTKDVCAANYGIPLIFNAETGKCEYKETVAACAGENVEVIEETAAPKVDEEKVTAAPVAPAEKTEEVVPVAPVAPAAPAAPAADKTEENAATKASPKKEYN